MGDIAILGSGHTLLSDEGVGVHVVERLRAAYAFPAHVRLLDGGTRGIELMGWLDGVDRLLVVTAITTHAPPGTLTRLADDAIPAHPGLALSPHQTGLRDLLAMMDLLGTTPVEIVLWGVTPASREAGVSLSPAVAAQMDVLVAHVLDELYRWGVEPWPMKPSVPAGELPT